MPSVRYNTNISGGGLSVSGGKTRDADSAEAVTATLPAGKTVTSWVKTDADTAGCNLPSGHGYSNGNFDVYWSGGSRYGVPGTISTNALTLDGGTGDDFPASATVGVVVCRQVQVNIAIDGDNLTILGIKPAFATAASTSKAMATFHDAADDQIAHLELNANQVSVYDITGGDTNPFTGDPITYALCSNGDASEACTLQIIRGQDSTP